MKEETEKTSEQILLQIGAVCAILGSVIQVAAGTGFGNRTVGASAESVLRYIAARPDWYWPTVHLGFIFGALLWVGALIALAGSLTQGISWALGRLGVAGIIVGATIHIVASSINGFGLTAVAHAWAVAPASEQASLLRAGDTLLWIEGGAWAGAISFFHGVPFILFGLAVALSRRYPAWLGWVGAVGGSGSLVLGTMMFLGRPEMLYVAFAIVVSVWMVAMGVLMWRRADAMGDVRWTVAAATQTIAIQGATDVHGSH
ncbi:MAG: hypothetical protein ACR2M3_10340 [Thermomicrobiales bacterium]